jgi:hypothetical protein
MDTSHYGRYWLIEIYCNNGQKIEMGSDGFDGAESLRCTFEINYPGYDGWYFSEFNIWNPTVETERLIIEEGNEVYFYAGYANGLTGQIFGGHVYQSLWKRENVTDYKLTLWCMDGDRLFKDNYVKFTLNSTYTDQTLLAEATRQAHRKIDVGKVTAKVDSRPKLRGVSFIGSPHEVIRRVARKNSAQFFMRNNKLEVVSVDDPAVTTTVEVNAKTGLIGSPQQIDCGVSFRSLLNPLLMITNPLTDVILDMSSISVVQQKATPGENLVAPLPVRSVPGWRSKTCW